MGASLRDFVSDAALERVTNGNGTLHRLPGVVFKDPEFLRLEFQNWLGKTWLFVGRGADLPEAGDSNTAPGLPIFLVRGKDGRIRAFHNACRHRGHRLVAEKRRGLLRFVCPYHCWTYDLEGRLVATPNVGGEGQHSLPGLDPAEHSLIPVRCETWHDWIFINMSGDAEPLADFTAPMAERLHFVDFSKLRHFLTMERRPIEANWKICTENTMEPYHVPYVHKDTAAGQPLGLHYMVEEDPIVGCAIDIEGSDYDNSPGGGSVDNLDMSARYLLRMPNLFLTSYAPDVIVDTLYVPDYQNPRRSWVEQAWYTTSGRVMSEDEIAQWTELEEVVLEEDVGIMAEVQAGVESVAVDDGGILSPAWESCISGFYKHLVRQLQG